jgi:hypothetical protein
MIIFSPRVKDVIYSKEEALRLGHDFIGTEHLLGHTEMEMEKQSDFKQSRY